MRRRGQDRSHAVPALPRRLTTGSACPARIFRDSSDVTADVTGDPDEAGFVQVMQGSGSNPDRAREIMAQNRDESARPERRLRRAP